VVRSKKTYYIYRSKAQDKVGATTLMEMVKNSMSLVLGEKGVDKRNVLYNRQGHKRIQIKKVNKQN
jgi:RNase P/RNase MRP subunit POP5